MNHHPQFHTIGGDGPAAADLAPCASAAPLSGSGDAASAEPKSFARQPLSRSDVRELIRLKLVSDLCRFS